MDQLMFASLSLILYWYEVGMLKVPAMYYIISVLFLLFVWCACMEINVSVQYNGELLPNIILLTYCYYHRGTRLNALKEFCICSL